MCWCGSLGPRYRVIGSHGLYEKYGLDTQEDMLRTGGRPDDEGWALEPENIWGRLYTDSRRGLRGGASAVTAGEL